MLLRMITTGLCVLLFAAASEAATPAIDCLQCHGDLERGKSVHPALAMGCETCHSAIDASDVPHKKKNKFPKGLSADQPDLCYNCHDKAMFTKKNVHPALALGCTTCHNPHASNAASLLIDSVGKLCVTCHEKQAKGTHIMTGFALGDTHPLQGRADPAKPSRELSCISCHNPHSSARNKLFVNESATGNESLCRMCHRKISVRTDKP